jgi:hypothetical protein
MFLGDHLPDCLFVDERCTDCPYWDMETCPSLQDPEYRWYLLARQSRSQELQRTRIESIRDAMRLHGIPLHWESVAAIVGQTRPDLFVSPRSVLRVLTSHPDIFEYHAEGVYSLTSS